MLLLLLGAVAALACGQFVPDLMVPWDGDEEIGGVTLRQQQPRSTPTTPQSGVLAIDTLDKVVVYTPPFLVYRLGVCHSTFGRRPRDHPRC